MNGVEALGKAMDTMAAGNNDSEITVANEVFFLIGAAMPLAMAWSYKLAEDQGRDFTDSMDIPHDPSKAAQAAADYAKYTADSSQMNEETGYQNNILQNQKTQVRTLGTALDAVYNLAEAPAQELESLGRILLTFASMS
jgi:hypothetical protein